MFVRLKLPQGAWSTLYFSDLATISVNGKNVETTKDCKSLLSWFFYFSSFEARFLSGLRCLWMLNQHFTFEMKHRRRVRDFFENTVKCKIFTFYFFLYLCSFEASAMCKMNGWNHIRLQNIHQLLCWECSGVAQILLQKRLKRQNFDKIYIWQNKANLTVKLVGIIWLTPVAAFHK